MFHVEVQFKIKFRFRFRFEVLEDGFLQFPRASTPPSLYLMHHLRYSSYSTLDFMHSLRLYAGATLGRVILYTCTPIPKMVSCTNPLVAI